MNLKNLAPKKSYRDLEKEIIDYFFEKSTEELESGVRLNNSDDTSYIKKRLKGRGGYRCYFLLVLKNESLYLMFVHPKTGTSGSSNITDESKTYLYKKVFKSIENQDLYELNLDETKKQIIFSKSVEIPV